MKPYTRPLVAIGIVVSLIIASQFLYVLPIHILAFVISIATVVIADSHALLWVLGYIKTLPAKRLHILHETINVSLLVSITTGIIMTIPVYDYLFTQGAFLIKIALVLALVLNSLVIAKHMGVASTCSFKELTFKQRWPLLVSGLVSTGCWLGVVIAAQFLEL